MTERFLPGDKVYLIHLRETGMVTRLNGAEMVFVQLKDMEIPVYLTDIKHYVSGVQPPVARSKHETSGTASSSVKSEKAVEKKDSGIFLCFEPVSDRSGDIIQFRISIANDTGVSMTFRYRFFLGCDIHFQLDRHVSPYEAFPLHEISYDALNDLPEVDIQVRDMQNALLKGELVQKIKPQNFFNKLGKAALTGTDAYIYPIKTTSVHKPATKSPQKKQDPFDLSALKAMMMDSPPNKDIDLVEPSREVDLHIEKLVRGYHHMDNAEMLHIQLSRFQQSLDQAIASGVDRFYVIHGNGKGKLKREIHTLLKTYKEVRSFNNDYHPKYAHGATEIILR